MNLKNITLELSGKAFMDNSEAAMAEVCRKMFTQWRRLTDQADRVSVMLWIADGSEILTYSGDLQQEFEWAYWVGCANAVPLPPDATDRHKRNTHHCPQKYREDIELRSYAWLKRLIEIIKETGQEITGKPIRAGAIFDNGPEFAVSEFKYNTHRELAQGHTLYPHSFITCDSVLHADDNRYAGFPGGIPEGTSLGTFLGRQYAIFADDLGYDYIWLSNGMGFGTETWKITGALFDGQRFLQEKSDEAAEKMLRFWRDFSFAAPGVAIETRGSNFSAGVEIASDAAPLKEIYNEFKIAPPVNSPWAALNFNSGLELAAWMSHVAELPGDYFPFRFYTHDPWFHNSPWLDRYGRSPWDIYQPLSICRIDEDGNAQTPNSISILTVDDTYGNMPDQVPDEVIPHLLSALREAPDASGPLLWIYPFEEYNQRRNLEQTFNEDLFLGEAIQQGLPLNSVISTDNFRKLSSCGQAEILVAPVTALESCFDEIVGVLNQGRKLLVYGSIKHASQKSLDLLGLCCDVEITGKVSIQTQMIDDVFESGSAGKQLIVMPQYDGGGLCETAAPGTRILAESSEHRVIASVRDNVGFVRSLMAHEQKQAFNAAALMRQLLSCWGWKMQYVAFSPGSTLPRTTILRNDNAFLYTVFALDTNVDIVMNTPLGAPVLTEMSTRLKDGDAIWRSERCLHQECRCFVKQEEDSVISCKTSFPAYPGYTGRYHYSGLKNAEVRFYPPKGFEDTLEIMTGSEPLQLLSDLLLPLTWENTQFGPCIVLENISGHLNFAW